MNKLLLYRDGIINSYGQIFFSNHRWFGVLLLLASFVNPGIGVCGLLSALIAVASADVMGFSKEQIASGLLSFNSILVGFTLSVFFDFNWAFWGILFLAAFFTMLISVWLNGFFASYKIPFLSLPFMLGIWTILLAVKGYGAVQWSESGIYTTNEIYRTWGEKGGKIMEQLLSFKFPLLMDVYLKSLGAVFFQYNLLVGLLVAIGLLLYSRIAFILSVLGFLTGYYFCLWYQSNMSELEYSYIGFNYILSAIALGGFFLIPSKKSFLLVLISSLIIAISIAALGRLLFQFGLPVYSLPFSLVVMLLLYILLLRYEHKGLELVNQQRYSPEKNLYAYLHNQERYKNDTYFHIHLPFFGQWMVSQGHSGKITHKEDWRFALDFVVTDETQKTFKNMGETVSDFYCYSLPVLAPAAGYVVNLIDGIEDNEIKGVNLHDNWGNAIVIKHADFLYSKLTHLKQASFKVKIGDYVRKGDILATCGNSGRSPEPHIHFQLQSTPYIGAKTLSYPIAYFVSKLNGNYTFHSFEIPKENQQIFKISPTAVLSQAFYFIPGMTLDFDAERDGKTEKVQWEIFTDAFNHSYFYCHQSGSTAYFVNNETLFYFTEFKGHKNSLLYYFYLAAHKILLAYYPNIKVDDIVPLDGFFNWAEKSIQDVIAPFKVYQKVQYQSEFTSVDNELQPKEVGILSRIKCSSGNTTRKTLDFTINVSEGNINTFTVNTQNICISAKRLLG